WPAETGSLSCAPRHPARQAHAARGLRTVRAVVPAAGGTGRRSAHGRARRGKRAGVPRAPGGWGRVPRAARGGGHGHQSIRAARGLLSPIVRPPFDIMGPRFVSWLIAWPRLFRRSPRSLQDFLTARAVRPAGASWLASRLASVPITAGRTIAAAIPTGSRLRLRLDDGTERLVDHLLLATGYRVDASRYAFLAPTLLQALRPRDGYPALDVGLESCVPGLHFLGTLAAGSFGPLCRCVFGPRDMALSLTRHIT